MDWLPNHQAGLSLTHNTHKHCAQTVEEWIVDHETYAGSPEFDWVSPEEREKAIRENSVWVLFWYPDTLTEFMSVAASSLEAIRTFLSRTQT